MMTMISRPPATQRRRRIAGVVMVGVCLVGVAGCRPAATESLPETDASAVIGDQAVQSSPDRPEQSQTETASLRKVAVAKNHEQTAAVDAPPPKVDDESEQEETTTAAAAGETVRDLAPAEYWDASYIAGSKVGHFHMQIVPLEEGDRKLLKLTQDGHITVKRFGTTITQTMATASVETPAGQLVRCESVVTLGPSPVSVRGEVVDRSLDVVLSSLGKRSKKTLAWNPDWGGFFAAEQSMRRRPLKPGETRKFKALTSMGTDVAVADITLTAHDYESTELLDGPRKLLKVTVSQETGGPGDVTTTAWIDENGDSLKQFMPGMDLTTYRVSREKALGEADGEFDLGDASTVKLARPLLRAHDSQRLVYHVTLAGGDPAKAFANCGSQQVKSLGENKAEVIVTAVRPDSPARLPVKPTPPTEKDLAPNNLIQSDDAGVKQLAASVFPEETDPWQTAQDLERSVARSMKSKNFSTAFATAAEVARSLEGDCTEHAVLLAAMCRARKIPARVAIGLVYYQAGGGFAFHMWNEVWIKDRWVPLDATLGQGGIGAAHLKMADSDLAGTDAYSTFLPVAKVMGQLKIEVIEAE